MPLSDPAVFWELSGDLFSVYDPEGRFVDVNPAWERVMGWERDQLLGRLATDFMHPDDLAAAAAVACTAASGTGRVREAESRYLCADGSYRWLTWSAFTDGDGWCAVGKDITCRKEIEAARDAAQQRAADAFELAGLSTWWWHIASDRVILSGELEAAEHELGHAPTLEGSFEQVQPSHRSKLRRAVHRVAEGVDESFCIRFPAVAGDEVRWLEARGAAVRGEGGGIEAVKGTTQDVTEAEVAHLGERLRARMLDQVDAAVVVTDLEGTVTLWSGGAERLYGWSDEEAVGERIEDLTVPAHFHPLMAGFTQHLLENGRWEGDLKLRRKDDSHFIGFTRSSVIRNDDGAPIGVVGISVDNTERVQAQQDLRKARDYLTAGIDSMGEGLIAVDPSGGVLYMNATAEERLGWTCAELRGSNLHDKVHSRRPDGSQYPIEECPHMAVAGGREGVQAGEDVLFRRDGSPLPISYTATPFELAEGESGAVIVFADITERKRAEAALRTSEAQMKAIVENTSAVIYVKRKDDYRYLMGNPAFESLLGLEPGAAAGHRDEDFVPPAVVERVRETDRRAIEEGAEVSLEEEVAVAGETRTYLTLKVPLPDEHGQPYAVCGISTDITERKRREAELTERLEWEERIRTAVREDRLLIYAQPIIDLRTGEVVQEELLVRMQGARGTDDVIPPGEFLPQAERFGVVGGIDRYMVDRGIALAAAGRSVEINLSGHSIGDRALTRDIERQLHATGADPSKIVFEITESAAVEDMDAAREFSDRIAALGCKCALDDFGTGYGSLTYQRHLTVQYLKIDISFVRGMADSTADQQVVRSIVKLARDYGQQTVAEGVEDEETLQLLREFGVDYAQGYHIGRPHPVTAS